MKTFTIQYKGFSSFKEESGDDFVDFECKVYSSDNPDKYFPELITYKMFEKQIVENIERGAEIVKRMHKEIKGWGTHESLYVNEFEECGIDNESMVKKAVLANYDLGKEAEKWKNFKPIQAEASKILNDLGNELAGMKSKTINYYQLCENLEKVIINKVTRLFPVLLESSPDCIRKL